MNTTPPFRLTLFGSPRLTDPSGSLVTGRVSQRHRLALLALLALPRRGGWSRDKLLGFLWPERDTEHGRQLLNQAVYMVRKSLGDMAIVSSADALVLNDRIVRVDAREFEAALQHDDHAAAVEHYAGPLLDGFFLSHAPEFDQWAERERERLAGSYAGALEALAQTAADADAAARWWKRRANHDPYDSRIALQLMEALAASGNPAGALQHARRHELLLEREFGVAPSHELHELVARLRSGYDVHETSTSHDAASRRAHGPLDVPPAGDAV